MTWNVPASTINNYKTAKYCTNGIFNGPMHDDICVACYPNVPHGEWLHYALKEHFKNESKRNCNVPSGIECAIINMRVI